jgi:3-hydroxyacyl-CoA dehydrogenase
MSETNISKVGICGSGIMGSGLAEVAAKAGYTVIVRSRSAASAQAMITSIEKGLDKQVSREKITAEDKAAILGRLSATDKIADLADCDLVIESVVEDLAVKKALFIELDKAVKPSAILATNTSTLPVIEMAMATGRPDKVCGIHFFNPATAMPLVEVVRPITASDDTMAAANAFVAMQLWQPGVQRRRRSPPAVPSPAAQLAWQTSAMAAGQAGLYERNRNGFPKDRRRKQETGDTRCSALVRNSPPSKSLA